MGIRQNEQKINLLSMTDFVLEQTKINQFRDDCEFAYPVRKYANFLKQPLELWMFVPCDENGNILEAPQLYFEGGAKEYLKLQKEYQQAKERCLFLTKQGEVFDWEFARIFIDEFFNIEQLSNEIRNIQLTQTAIKQLGL